MVVFLAVVTVFVFVGVIALASERYAISGHCSTRRVTDKASRAFHAEDNDCSGAGTMEPVHQAFLDGDIVNILVGFGPVRGWGDSPLMPNIRLIL